MNKEFRCIAIDDDKLFLRKVDVFAEEIPWLEILATYSNPVQGATAVISENPDLILLDMEMPHIDGLYLLDWLEPRWKNTQFPKVIIISSLDLENGSPIKNIHGVIHKNKLNTPESFKEELEKILG